MVSIGGQGAQDRLLHLRGLLEVPVLHGPSVILCFRHRAMYRCLTFCMLRTEGVWNRTGFEQAAGGCLRAAEQDPCRGPLGVPASLQCPGVLDERRAGDLPRRGRRGCGDPQVLSVIRGSTIKINVGLCFSWQNDLGRALSHRPLPHSRRQPILMSHAKWSLSATSNYSISTGMQLYNIMACGLVHGFCDCLEQGLYRNLVR